MGTVHHEKRWLLEGTGEKPAIKKKKKCSVFPKDWVTVSVQGKLVTDIIILGKVRRHLRVK